MSVPIFATPDSTVLTWLGNTNSDVSTLELCAGQFKCLFQAIKRAELDVAETLWLPVQFVLDNAHIRDLTFSEEIVDVALGSIERQISQVSGIWGL